MDPSEPIIHNFLQGNPYFTAGFGLIGVGAGLTALKQGGTRLALLLQRRYLTSVEVTSKDPSYHWVLQWLAKSGLNSGNHYSVQTARRTGCGLVPSTGVHYLRWRGSWMKVSRERERSASLDGLPFETVRMTMLGQDKRQAFLQILNEAKQAAEVRTRDKLILYTPFANEWRPFGSARRRRPLDSVVLEEGLAETILADIQEFLKSGKWYEDRGIPYRRGYMLHGPPGTGKSSFIQALSSHLGYNICLLNLSDGMVTDDRLAHLLVGLPERSCLLVEDVDAVTLDGAERHGLSRLTLSGLLNALDGVGSSEERIVFMTTNHLSRLPPALIRPGRIDSLHLFDLASPDQAHRMFLRFYPDHEQLAEEFVRALGQKRLSPATIQGHFIQHKESPENALQNIQSIL